MYPAKRTTSNEEINKHSFKNRLVSSHMFFHSIYISDPDTIKLLAIFSCKSVTSRPESFYQIFENLDRLRKVFLI